MSEKKLLTQIITEYTNVGLEETINGMTAYNKNVESISKSMQNVSATPSSPLTSLTTSPQSFGGIDKTISKMGNLASAVSNATHIFYWFEAAQERLENSQLRLANATDTYNNAVQKYGANSQQAVSAQRSMEIAQNNLDRAHHREILNIGLLSVQMVMMIRNSWSLISSTVAVTAAKTAEAGASGAVTSALQAENAAKLQNISLNNMLSSGSGLLSKLGGWGGIGVGFMGGLAAAVIGYGASKGFEQLSNTRASAAVSEAGKSNNWITTNININARAEDLMSALDKANNQAKNNVRQEYMRG